MEFWVCGEENLGEAGMTGDISPYRREEWFPLLPMAQFFPTRASRSHCPSFRIGLRSCLRLRCCP